MKKPKYTVGDEMYRYSPHRFYKNIKREAITQILWTGQELLYTFNRDDGYCGEDAIYLNKNDLIDRLIKEATESTAKYIAELNKIRE